MSRYVKCRLTLDTREEFDFLLGAMKRCAGTMQASDEYRKSARSIYSALQFHYDSCGFRKFEEED